MEFDPNVYRENIEKPIAKLSIPRSLFEDCAVIGCENKDIEVHHVRALNREKHGFKVETIGIGKKRISGPSMIQSALARKQIPLCKKHHAI